VHLHDVVVIGAGPAGLSAAAELARTHDCLLVDLGRDADQRDRDDAADILAGIGGAGLFSDGKHSFWPSASALWTLPDQAVLADAFDRTAALLARHGVIASAWHPTTPDPPTPGAWHSKNYPSIYMSLPDRMAAIAELASACPQRWTGARVLAAAREPEHLRLTIARAGTLHDIHTKTLVVATGRLSPRWIRPWLTAARRALHLPPPRVRPAHRVACRLPAVPAARAAPTPSSASATSTPRARPGPSACVATARSSSAARSPTSPTISAWSGRADGPPSGRSNLGLLVRTSDEPLARADPPRSS
jgi:2-polyprenyl-6-methoxyphenol hydroxylase-like FAD-dependent oxidoreductase